MPHWRRFSAIGWICSTACSVQTSSTVKARCKVISSCYLQNTWDNTVSDGLRTGTTWKEKSARPVAPEEEPCQMVVSLVSVLVNENPG